MGVKNKISNESKGINYPETDKVYDVGTLFSINKKKWSNSEVDPITVNVQVQGKVVRFEVDTGASVRVCSQEFYQNNLRMCKLLANDLTLRYYANEPVEPLGK